MYIGYGRGVESGVYIANTLVGSAIDGTRGDNILIVISIFADVNVH